MLNLEKTFESDTAELEDFIYNGEEIQNKGKVTFFKIIPNLENTESVN